MKFVTRNLQAGVTDERRLVGRKALCRFQTRRSSSAVGFITTVVCVLASLCWSASPSLEQRYVAHLRQRGMHRLAEVYCQQRLAAEGLTDRERVEMAIERSLVAVSRAYDAVPGERDGHWRQAYSCARGLARDGRPAVSIAGRTARRNKPAGRVRVGAAGTGGLQRHRGNRDGAVEGA